jgi:DNA replication protein DnaC
MSDSVESRCGECGGTGFAIVEAGGVTRARPCACRHAAAPVTALEGFLDGARVPQRYRECEFQNFDAYGEHSFSLANAKARAIRYADEYPLSDSGLLFMGPPGVGKTHLGVATLRRLMVDKGVPCLFCDVQDLLRRLQATFDRQSGLTELQLLQPVLATEVVLLDDLGGRQFSPWLEETLAHIVTTRYNDKRATIVTTNYLDRSSARHVPSLGDRIGPRVRSRLHEMCHLVMVEADDFRSKIKLADHYPLSGRSTRPGEGA